MGRLALLVVLTMLGIASAAGEAAAVQTRHALSAPVDGTFSVGPPRQEFDLRPGDRVVKELEVTNNTGSRSTYLLKPVNLRGGDSSVESTDEDVEFGAVSWMDVEVPSVTIDQGETAVVSVTFTAPPHAGVGSHYAGIVVAGQAATKRLGDAGRVNTSAQIQAQFFITVPGDLVRDGKITSFELDRRLIFRDLSFAGSTWHYENRGTATDHIQGTVKIRSIFGNTVREYPFKPHGVLRGGGRTEHVLWTNPPLFGVFREELVLDTDGGKRTARTGWMLVAPPWWWCVIGIGLVAGTVWQWRRRRRMWRELVSRLEEADRDEDSEDLDGW